MAARRGTRSLGIMIDDGPICMELDLGNAPAAKNGIPRRAATEGRAYSTFCRIWFIRSAGFRRLEGRGNWVRGLELEATQGNARGLRGRHSEIDLRAMNRRAAVLG